MDPQQTINWQTFKDKVIELRATYHKLSSPLLFRGQTNSEWKLSNTLERSGAGRMLFREYHDLVCAGIAPEVKSLAGIEVPEYKPAEVTDTYLDPELLTFPGRFPDKALYECMVHLRHLGFPSPLLD